MGADPVADKSGFLCMYMSNHPDTLVSYVRYWGKITAQVSSAKMNGIDTNVRCPPPFPSPSQRSLRSSSTREVRVPSR